MHHGSGEVITLESALRVLFFTMLPLEGVPCLLPSPPREVFGLGMPAVNSLPGLLLSANPSITGSSHQRKGLPGHSIAK
jgi:hypothetical protein